ncbi:hypothetical protein GCK72_000890 [Caenorhabditis remanei]|uniref:Uncharacterized protein n=1 Tax=Caenorhabditis remanei TaxID=31234 RepID=A0A6A5HRW1_CAERE|nr:hypothetical protein GCK72_000890 [Caenorhabditis remanei]KAF1769077.1 hypothetical protein GCK72_000890 [Caenorhabditis remanei]
MVVKEEALGAREEVRREFQREKWKVLEKGIVRERSNRVEGKVQIGIKRGLEETAPEEKAPEEKAPGEMAPEEAKDRREEVREK